MLSKFSNVVLNLNQACREQPIHKFQDFAFELIKSVVPFDSALWLTGSFDGAQHFAHSRHFHKQPLQVIQGFEQNQERRAFAERTISAAGITFNCVTSKYFSAEVAEHYHRQNIEHMLVTTAIESVTNLHELISIYRADPNQPFSEKERLFQQNLVPHLAETWRINRINKLYQDNRTLSSPDLYFAEADIRGVFHLIDPGFACLLQDEWPDWCGPWLPIELAAKIESAGNKFVGNKIVVQISSLHNQFLLRGRKKSGVDLLSTRENEVAQLFSEGHTSKEIAALLDLSPATVRNHVSAIYSKLDISSKAELANHLKEAG